MTEPYTAAKLDAIEAGHVPHPSFVPEWPTIPCQKCDPELWPCEKVRLIATVRAAWDLEKDGRDALYVLNGVIAEQRATIATLRAERDELRGATEAHWAEREKQRATIATLEGFLRKDTEMIVRLNAERDEAWNLVRDREAQLHLDRGKLAEAEAEVARLREACEKAYRWHTIPGSGFESYLIEDLRAALAAPGELAQREEEHDATCQSCGASRATYEISCRGCGASDTDE